MPTKEKDIETNKFNPEEWMTDIKGKKYLPVAARLVWFREVHPDWLIKTQIVTMTDTYAVMKAEIVDREAPIASAHKREDKVGFADYLEKAETGAIGRALAMCGFGTQFSPDIDEGSERIVDTPITRNTQTTTSAPKSSTEGIVGAVNSNSERVTLADLTAFYKIAGEAVYTKTEAAQLLTKTFGVEKVTDVTKKQLLSMQNAMQRKAERKKDEIKPIDLDGVFEQDLDSIVGE